MSEGNGIQRKAVVGHRHDLRGHGRPEAETAAVHAQVPEGRRPERMLDLSHLGGGMDLRRGEGEFRRLLDVPDSRESRQCGEAIRRGPDPDFAPGLAVEGSHVGPDDPARLLQDVLPVETRPGVCEELQLPGTRANAAQHGGSPQEGIDLESRGVRERRFDEIGRANLVQGARGTNDHHPSLGDARRYDAARGVDRVLDLLGAALPERLFPELDQEGLAGSTPVRSLPSSQAGREEIETGGALGVDEPDRCVDQPPALAGRRQVRAERFTQRIHPERALVAGHGDVAEIGERLGVDVASVA